MTRTVHCVKLGREAEGLPRPPWPGELGRRLYENVSKQAWQEWLGLQTMLINEKRLSLVNPEHKAYLAKQMEAHFFGEGADQPEGYIPPENRD